MEKTWRWFGKKDKITLSMLRQIGVLGRAIAKYLALNGARVVILGRKEDVGNQIASDIRAEGGECEFMKTEELCGTIHYLMSDASKFVTGTVAVVDGGFNMFAM